MHIPFATHVVTPQQEIVTSTTKKEDLWSVNHGATSPLDPGDRSSDQEVIKAKRLEDAKMLVDEDIQATSIVTEHAGPVEA